MTKNRILFRGKQKSWVYGGCVIDDNGCKIIDQYETFEVDPDSVGQFTGQQTNEGQLIFSGDIFEIKLSDQTKIRKLVRYKARLGGFCIANTYDLIDENRREIWGVLTQKYVKELNLLVVGNEMDNPELLKQ